MVLQLEDSYKTKGLRKKLVKELSELGISDKQVLNAIGKVPRHFFLETAFTAHAYKNKAFPIGGGQTISHPFTVAFQSQLLEIKKGDKILEIGTGSGYQTSILHELGAKIFTVERLPDLTKKAKIICQKIGVRANFLVGDGSTGWKNNAPYDGIIVTAGAPTITEELINQLKIGGVLVIPVGDENQQEIKKITKLENDQWQATSYSGFSFVPLLGKNAW